MDVDLSNLEGFEWDEGNLGHIKKHKVNYKECEEAFLNLPLKLNSDTKHSKIEKRLQALGKTNNERLLFISFTIRNKKIRVISARNQNKKEHMQFQEAGGENL